MSGRDFQGVNAGYVEELYERFRQDPASVDAETRRLFESGWAPASSETAGDHREPAGAMPSVAAVVGAVKLADCIRRYGHLAAQLDPLGASPPGIRRSPRRRMG